MTAPMCCYPFYAILCSWILMRGCQIVLRAVMCILILYQAICKICVILSLLTAQFTLELSQNGNRMAMMQAYTDNADMLHKRLSAQKKYPCPHPSLLLPVLLLLLLFLPSSSSPLSSTSSSHPGPPAFWDRGKARGHASGSPLFAAGAPGPARAALSRSAGAIPPRHARAPLG